MNCVQDLVIHILSFILRGPTIGRIFPDSIFLLVVFVYELAQNGGKYIFCAVDAAVTSSFVTDERRQQPGFSSQCQSSLSLADTEAPS